MLIVTYPGSGMREIERIFRQSGHDLVIVPSLKSARSIKFDRLLLLGGVDIDPYNYGQPNILSFNMDTKRDAIELTLAKRALKHNIPTLGICRGHQMMAIAAGGSLIQDIPYDYGIHGHNNMDHRIIVHNPLDRWIPSNKVNSYHHQCIDTIPSKFKVVATSNCGIIEAIYKPGFLGVQFHPEYLYVDNWRWITLFRWFIEGLK